LRQQGVQVILRQNDEGRLYGVTFIDQKNKTVFNGSDLGKEYSANALSAKFLPESKPEYGQTQIAQWETNHELNSELQDILFRPENEDIAALNKFKKKKRKGLNL
jgi:hypothetical protein